MTINPINLGRQAYRSAGNAANGATVRLLLTRGNIEQSSIQAWNSAGSAVNHATGQVLLWKDMAEKLPSLVRTQKKAPILVKSLVEAGWDPLLRTTKKHVKGLVPNDDIMAQVASHFQDQFSAHHVIQRIAETHHAPFGHAAQQIANTVFNSLF